MRPTSSRGHASRARQLLAVPPRRLPRARAAAGPTHARSRLRRRTLSRDLKALGTTSSASTARRRCSRRRARRPEIETHLADAASLPFDDDRSTRHRVHVAAGHRGLRRRDREAARVLEPGGRFCIAIVHPLNSAGLFDGAKPTARSRSRARTSTVTTTPTRSRGTGSSSRSSARTARCRRTRRRSGRRPAHRALREPAVPDHAMRQPRSRRWQRLPLFLHLRAVKR